MVFSGKPSRACQECRSRRTKCDQRTPSCSQCVRTQRKCFGYRDVQNLLFRDQSEAIMKKFQPQAVRAKQTERLHRLMTFAYPPASALQQSVEVRAMALFVSHYVLGKSRSFEYIDIFFATPVMDDHLVACLSAVSLADFAEEVHSDDLLKRARKQYISGLRSTNVALRDQLLVTKDSTLLAVLLLDLFEKITARHNHRPLADLTEHIDGATQLMILRSSDQFGSEAGVRMFNQYKRSIAGLRYPLQLFVMKELPLVLYIIIVSCVLRHANMPPEILTLRDSSATSADGGQYQWRQLDCIIRYVELRADIHTGKLSDCGQIMTLGKELDDDTAALARSIEDMWPYETYSTEDTASAYEGIYHVYGINFQQLKTWNSIRLGRITCNSIVQKAYLDGLASSNLSALEVHRAAQFQASLDATLDMALELCRAVPQYCMCLPESHGSVFSDGYSSSTSESCSDGSSSAGIKTPQKPTHTEEASAYAMIHPLNVAASSSAGKSAKLRAWIVDRLKFIGNHMSMPDALMVAELIETDTEIDPWIVFTRLAGHDAPVNPFDPPTSLLGTRTKEVEGSREKQEYLMLI